MSRTISRSLSSSRRLTDGGKLSRRRKCNGPPGCLETRSTGEFVVLDSECDEVKSPPPVAAGSDLCERMQQRPPRRLSRRSPSDVRTLVALNLTVFKKLVESCDTHLKAILGTKSASPQDRCHLGRHRHGRVRWKVSPVR